jgi:hypothetical protein
VFAFAFMAFITVQSATGFMYDLLGGVRPKALVAIDALINRLLVAPLGLFGAVMLLSVLSVAFAYLAYRRGLGEQHASTVRP